MVDVDASDRRIPELEARRRLSDRRFMNARLGYRDRFLVLEIGTR
jgi:hypothetical protein